MASKYPQGSIVRTVYSGEAPTQLSPIFKNPVKIKSIPLSVAYARVAYTNGEFSKQKRFRYFLETDSSSKDYSTLESVRLSIRFSSAWLAAKSDEVKDLAVEKEAIGPALFEGLSKIMLNTHLSQGKIERIDPNVTDQEIARTFAYLALGDNLDIAKLFDYAAYIAIMQKAGKLIEQNDPTIMQDLRATNIERIYRMAKDRHINFDQIKPFSQEFWTLAFNPDSPWVKMILDPSVPGPSRITPETT